MKQLSIIIIFLTLACIYSQAQEYEILHIDETKYPQISFELHITNGNNKSIDSFTINELSLPIEYTAKPIEPTNNIKPHTFVFLIENSYHFYKNKVSDEIITSIQQICHSAQPNDLINFIFFEPNTPHQIKYLSANTTTNHQILAQMVEYHFKPQTDSSKTDNHLYTSIEQTINYIEQNSNIYNPTFLTIIARSENICNTKMFSTNFLYKIKDSNIYINAAILQTESQNAYNQLSELCNTTNGTIYTFKKGELEPTIMQLFEKLCKMPPKIVQHSYKITFTTKQNYTHNIITTKLGNLEKKIEFLNPNKNNILLRHPSSIVAIIALLIIAISLIVYASARNKIIKKIDQATMHKMRKIQIQNKRLKQQIEKYRKHPIDVAHAFDNFNTDENLVASGQKTPKLVINNDGTHTTFDLNKLVITIGRATDNDIIIPNRTVSSYHATLSFEGGVFFITDQDSTNGIFVNDIRITKSKVHNNDIIRIGAIFAKLIY